MKDKRTWSILALVVWLTVLMPACLCNGPVDTPTPKPAVEPTATDETPPGRDVLDDLPEDFPVEMKTSAVRPRLRVEKAPTELPAVEIELKTSDCYRLRLWGFPFDEVVQVELYDPSGQFVAGHEETRERGTPDRGLKHIDLFLGGQLAGEWAVVVDSAGVGMSIPLPVAEPEKAVMSIAPEEVGTFPEQAYQCTQRNYKHGEQVVLFGAGFPPAQTLPLGIYEWQESSDPGCCYSLVYRQEVPTDEQGRFEVHKPLRTLVPDGERSYRAIVVLDPSASGEVHPGVGFSVRPGTGAPSEDVILELAVEGEALTNATVQSAVLAAVNRSYLSDYFGAPVTFLYSYRGSAVDASGEPWDPDLARELLAEAGYADARPAVFLYPEGDVEVATVAQDMARDLMQVGISVELVSVLRHDMADYAGTQAMAGESVLWLVRR